jgi:hypothetical protein
MTGPAVGAFPRERPAIEVGQRLREEYAAKRTASGSVYSYGTEFARYLLPLWAGHASWINVSLWGKLMGNAFIETFNGNLHEEANCTGSRPVSMPEC